MRHFLRRSLLAHHLQLSKPTSLNPSLRHAHRKSQKQPPKPPPPPTPPKPPKKAEKMTAPHGETWVDEYSWMSKLNDKVAMRHMDVYMEQEEKYTEAVLSETLTLQSKLQSEIASRLPYDLSSPPFRWGPWLYYRRIEEGKQFPVLCRRLASLNEEFISNKSPFSGFDFTSGKRIEQKLIDYNQEAERFGGYAFEELCEVSPDHRYIAYTMYDKDNDFFKLSMRDLVTGSLCDKPQADWVSNVAWAKNGQSLFYVVTDHYKRPCKLYCSVLGSNEDDVLLLEETKENVYVNIRHTKDFRFVTVYIFSTTASKVYLIDSANPLSGMTLVWDGEPFAHCVVEHHRGYLYMFTDAPKGKQPVDNHYLLRSPVDVAPGHRIWENVFVDDPDMVIVDVDFSETHLVLILREGETLRLCTVPLPLPNHKVAVRLLEHSPSFLHLPKHVCDIVPGPNYDFHSSTMRFTVSSPVGELLKMANTRRSAVAKDQQQPTSASPPPPPPPPPTPPAPATATAAVAVAADAEINCNSNADNNNEQQPQQPIAVAETASDYEQTREQRIKENRERLQKLGIVDLSSQLKSMVSTKRTPRRTNVDRKTPLKSPSLGSSEPRRSSRLQNAPPVSYTELKEEKSKRSRDIVLEEGAKPEVYTEEHEKLLGSTEMPWTFFVDGYRADGTRIYDSVSGKTCHQCRQKTLGQRTHCCKCNLVQGQFCGDCLYMRYGEHVVEANQNPNWVCPPCRGICNCSLCRQAKGWAPTGALYKRIASLGFKSVAHYLITTKRASPDSESSDAPQTAKRALPFEGMELPNDNCPDDKAVVEKTEINPQSENKAKIVGETDSKSAVGERLRKRPKKEIIDAGEESVRVSGAAENESNSSVNGPNSSTSTVNQPNSIVRRSARRPMQENIDVGEVFVKASGTPGEPVSAMKGPNNSDSKADSIVRRLRPRN